MLPIRLVIDTNVVVSAALNSDGLQRIVLLIATTKPARLYVSRSILEEYAGVLARPHLHIRKSARLQLLQLLKNHAHVVTPSRRIHVCATRTTICFSSAQMLRAPTTSLRAIEGISQIPGRRPR
jgi:uncharacterized protein